MVLDHSGLYVSSGPRGWLWHLLISMVETPTTGLKALRCSQQALSWGAVWRAEWGLLRQPG